MNTSSLAKYLFQQICIVSKSKKSFLLNEEKWKSFHNRIDELQCISITSYPACIWKLNKKKVTFGRKAKSREGKLHHFVISFLMPNHLPLIRILPMAKSHSLMHWLDLKSIFSIEFLVKKRLFSFYPLLKTDHESTQKIL